jgi:hypothetical protein
MILPGGANDAALAAAAWVLIVNVPRPGIEPGLEVPETSTGERLSTHEGRYPSKIAAFSAPAVSIKNLIGLLLSPVGAR